MPRIRYRYLVRAVVPLMVAFPGFAGEACSSATRAGRADPNASLTFENTTTDEVTVYLDRLGTRWIVGHVEPGRKARLRIPDFENLRTLTDLRVIVVPLGTNRDGNRISTTAGAICSETDSAQHLLAMHWSLRGRTLVSVPHGGGRR